MKYSLLHDKNRFASEIDYVIYGTSNEKFVLEAMFRQLFEVKHYSNVLDIGPGPGLISQPIYEHCDHLTLLEVLPEYEKILKDKFPEAEVVIGSIDHIKFEKKFDAIVLSHVLYYFPEDQWIDLINRLLLCLADGGELMIVVWDSHFITDIFLPRLKSAVSITPMMPISKLIGMLEAIADVESTKIPIAMTMQNDEQIIKLIAHMLGLEHYSAIESCKDELLQFKKLLVKSGEVSILNSNNILLRLKNK